MSYSLVSVGLFLDVSPSAGGMFQYAQSIVDSLSRLDQKKYSFVIVYSDASWLPVLERLGVAGHSLRHARFGRLIADLGMALRLPASICRALSPLINPVVRQLLALGCDMWIFPSQESISYQVPGVSVIGTIHDLMHLYESRFPEVGSPLSYFVRQQRFRNIARYCDALLVDSNVGRDHVVDSYHVPPNRIYPLPYVAPSCLCTTTPRSDFDLHYQLPQRFLFYPAQFWAHKNHLRLLDAISIVSADYPDISLVLTGAKRHAFKYVSSYTRKLRLESNVFFVGYVPDEDLSGFYSRARALVMPTFFGPTNIPPLEAHAMGCPVLISRIYGIPEQCGDAALYFNPMCSTDIARQILRVWTDDRLVTDLSIRGFQRSRRQGLVRFSRRVAEVIDAVSHTSESIS